MSHSTHITPTSYSQLAGIPNIGLSENLRAALASGRRATGIAAEVLALRRGPGKLTPQEYFYYRLWDAPQEGANKRRFVGKIAQHPMHVAAGAREWFAASADKILFQSIMDGVGLRTPELTAITQAGRYLPTLPTITDPAALGDKLRDPSIYPLFAKQVAGKYSLSVLSADGFDPGTDEVLLLDGTRRKVADVATSLTEGSGFLVQRRLSPAPDLAARFGQRLWSARLLALVTPSGPVIHRAVAKISTGTNPADNYWRPGNRLGAIDLGSGRITRVVHGAGADLVIQLAGSFHTARELLDHAALSTSGPKEGNADQVRLMTLHKGKGLEFPHVFLPAWEAGSFPPDYGDLSEERRLAYVAITRGMRRVTITHCDFRRGYASPSCFIADLPGESRSDGWLRGSDRLTGRRTDPSRVDGAAAAALLRQFG